MLVGTNFSPFIFKLVIDLVPEYFNALLGKTFPSSMQYEAESKARRLLSLKAETMRPA